MLKIMNSFIDKSKEDLKEELIKEIGSGNTQKGKKNFRLCH